MKSCSVIVILIVGQVLPFINALRLQNVKKGILLISSRLNFFSRCSFSTQLA